MAGWFTGLFVELNMLDKRNLPVNAPDDVVPMHPVPVGIEVVSSLHALQPFRRRQRSADRLLGLCGASSGPYK